MPLLYANSSMVAPLPTENVKPYVSYRSDSQVPFRAYLLPFSLLCASLSSLLRLKHSRHIPTSRRLLPLPESCFLQIATWLFPSLTLGLFSMSPEQQPSLYLLSDGRM